MIVLVEQIQEGGLTADEPFGVEKLAEALALGPNEARLKPSRGGTLKVHLQAIGHPILGDALYAPGEVQARATRLALHATALTLAHPATGEPLAFHSPTPF